MKIASPWKMVQSLSASQASWLSAALGTGLVVDPGNQQQSSTVQQTQGERLLVVAPDVRVQCLPDGKYALIVYKMAM